MDFEDLNSKQQKRMCELCETHIICGSSNSMHYQCEGRHCEQAIEYILDEVKDKIDELGIYNHNKLG